MGARIQEDFLGKLRRTRAFVVQEEEQDKSAVMADVTEKLKKLTSRLKADLRRELFSKEVSETIE